jgi:hypothetical protein
MVRQRLLHYLVLHGILVIVQAAVVTGECQTLGKNCLVGGVIQVGKQQ